MTTKRTNTKAKTGTCTSCDTSQRIDGARIVDHLPLPDEYRLVALARRDLCAGSGRSSAETCAINREKSQARTNAKRRAQVLAVREEASVVLDAILMQRTDLDEEFGKARRDELFKLALVGYRLEFPTRKQLNGIMWVNESRAHQHKLFCLFCGFLMARFDHGVWSKLTHKRREATIGSHMTICALQYLAGVRQLRPGARIDGYEDAAFADALRRRCAACKAPAGFACTSITGSRSDGIGGRLSYQGYLREPHEIRLVEPVSEGAA